MRYVSLMVLGMACAMSGCIGADEYDAEAVAEESEALTGANLLQKFAPLVLIHSQDIYLPADPAKVYAGSANVGGRLQIPSSLFGGEPLSGGRVVAPFSSRMTSRSGRTVLQFAFFYARNGCQGFRAGIASGLFSTTKRNFEWCDWAIHDGDWEHVMVVLTPDQQAVASMFFSQHGDGQWVDGAAVEYENGHPKVYVALNSHANYPHAEEFRKEWDIDLKIAAPIRWLSIGDVVSGEANVYGSRPFGAPRRWETWAVPQYVHGDNGRIAGVPFSSFDGKWGGERDDQPSMPPGLPGGITEVTLFGVAKTALFFGALKDRTHGSGPSSPWRQDWWTDLENPPGL